MAQQSGSHLYDDPVPLRREKRDKVYEELRATPETECSTLSATPSDSLDTTISQQSFPWPLPYCRLLRNNDFKDAPRKPVRVDPPKLPETGVCRTEPLPSISSLPNKSVPRRDLRLILVPETRKILQLAVEQDRRLKPCYLKDVSLPLTSGKSTFPAISEEEEIKSSAAKTSDVRSTSRIPQTLTQNNERAFIEEKLSGDQDEGRALVPSVMTEDINTRRTSSQEATLGPRDDIVRLNCVNNMKTTSWDLQKLKTAQEKKNNVDENTTLLTPRRPETQVVEVSNENIQTFVTSKPNSFLYDAN